MAEKHPTRPRDLNQWAKRMVDIATGEVNHDAFLSQVESKSSAAAELEKKGGTARAKSLSPERRKEIAKSAALARFSKKYR